MITCLAAGLHGLTVTSEPDRLSSIIFGALLALATTLFVQLLIVPRVEARKRREQRWEEDVHTLGVLLTFDLPPVVNGLVLNISMTDLLLGAPSPRETEETKRLRRETEDELKAQRQELASLRLRLSWLQDRIAAIALHNARTQEFNDRCGELYVRLMQLGVLALAAQRPTTDEDESQADALSPDIDEAIRRLLEVVSALGTTAPPRNSTLRRWLGRKRPGRQAPKARRHPRHDPSMPSRPAS